MTQRTLSARSLRARIETLTRRHRELDTRIEAEQHGSWPDMSRIKRLKQERLGLRDAIRMTRAILARSGGADGAGGKAA